MALVEIRDVSKSFTRGAEKIDVFAGLTLDVEQGSFTALMGPSARASRRCSTSSRGSTSRPAAACESTGRSERDDADAAGGWRSGNVGFVFQPFNLLPVLTAYQNVELPLLLTRLSKRDRDERVRIALGVVGLEDRMEHYPRQLSGGQEQRVAIARAIVADPTLVLLDEPTGQLDAQSSQEVLALLARLNDEFGKTILIVTHDPQAAARAGRQLHLEKGTFVEQADAVGVS